MLLHAARMHEDAKRATGQEIDRLESSGRSGSRWSLHRQPLSSRGHAALTPPAWGCWPITTRAKRHCLPPCHGGVCYAARLLPLPLPFDTRQAASHGWMLQIPLGPFWGVNSSAVWSASCPPHWPASLHLLSWSLLYCRGADDACGVDGHINNAVSCHAQGPRSHCWCLPVIASRA
jgi:hypothetical protein